MLTTDPARADVTGDENALVGVLLDAEGFLSFDEASRRIGVQLPPLAGIIALLEKRGFEIDAHPHLGLRLSRAPDLLLPALLTTGLKTVLIGKRVRHAMLLDSSNSEAERLAVSGEPEGTVVVAERQSAGRGRLGRAWFSPENLGIYLSVILKPPLRADRASFLTLCAAVSVTEAIRNVTGLEAAVKWPNDVILSGKKVCGILTEIETDGGRLDHAILGVGLNANQERGGFPPELYATSLKIELGAAVSRLELARAFLEALEKSYTLLESGDYGGIIDRWLDLSVTVGRRIRATSLDGRVLEGVATGLDENGCLLLRLDGGLTKRVTGGDISLLQ